VSIDTVLTFLAKSVGQEVATRRHFVLLIAMKVLALLSLFAIAFQVVNTNYFFVLALVRPQILRLVQSY